MGDLFLKMGDYINAIDFYNKSIKELGCFEIDSCLTDLLAFSDSTFSLVELYESYFYKGVSELNYFKNKNEFEYLISSIKSFNAASTLSDVIRNQYTSEKAKRKINETTMFLNENYIQALIILKSKYNHDVDNTIIEIMERNKYTALRSSLHTTKWSYNENIPKYISRTIDSLQKRNRYIKSQKSFNKSSDESFKINFQIDSIYNYLISKSQNFKKSLYSFNYHTIEEIQNKLNDSTGIITFSIFDTTLILVALNNKDYKIQFRKVNYSLHAQLQRLLMSVKFSDTKSLISEGIQLNNVFIQPLQEIINHLSSIILIPDPKLFNIPFDLLISNNGIDSPEEIADQNYLLTKFNISYQYSMNLWVDNLTIKNDQLENKWRYSFSGFAPFAYSDEDNMEDKYNKLRLPYSRIEVNNICNLYNEFNKNYRAFIGLESQESIIVNSFQDSQIVHIASHTFINENSTDFYIAIQNNIKESETVTTITEDLINSTFYSSTDGGLYLSEIFNLDISSELVTLSTCQSGYGNHYDGEGVISFTQGFYFSGAKKIIYTLWDVSDKHTMEFM
ncbi:CHAT domain-containing protein, partial [Candidatus Woesearchaeota archaeon]|nr:CHAT domain-containing protein [Candidatus Woesearchaeota archaeon]